MATAATGQHARLESAIYRGRVRHRRFTPRTHNFSVPLFMLWLKVDEIPAVLDSCWQLGTGRCNWGRFRRQDYIGDNKQNIAAAVKTKIAELLGCGETDLAGDVFMLCHLRYLGIYFSPLTLYYLRQDGRFRYLLAEVSNTPWNERHYYLLDVDKPAEHAKTFHVSPFNPMNQHYRWRLTPPHKNRKSCAVHIESLGGEGDEKVFDATLSLKRLPLNQSQLSRVLRRTPVQTLNIMAGIYWQALKLILKRIPVYPHPEKAKLASRKGTL